MSQNLQICSNFKNFSLRIWLILKNAAKRIFSCKNRSRYSRKRATFCGRRTPDSASGGPPPPPPTGSLVGERNDVRKEASKESWYDVGKRSSADYDEVPEAVADANMAHIRVVPIKDMNE